MGKICTQTANNANGLDRNGNEGNGIEKKSRNFNK